MLKQKVTRGDSKMREWMKILGVCVLAVLVCVGCSKKAKVNLDGLDQQRAGTVTDGDGGFAGPNGGGGLSPIGAPGDALIVPTAAQTGMDANAGTLAVVPAGWQETDQAVNTGADGLGFVKNGQYFAQKVYFDYNRSEVRPSERVKLEQLASHLLSNASLRVVIEGHCDERGSDEYNRALSERRSLSVQEYLVSLGVDISRMRTVSYGEDRPEVPNAQSESDHQLNRRAQFLIGTP